MKLAIDCGHGLYTAGKETYAPLGYGVIKEWELNNSVGVELENLLKDYEGVEVKRLDDRTGKTDVSLRNRTNAANAWGADLLLSIHFNAGLYGKKGGGITVHGYPGSSKTTDAILRSLYNELIAAGGLKGNRSNPIVRDNFHMVRESNMRAILIENGFMDSADDMPTVLQKEYHKKLAQGYVNFLVKEYGIKKKSGVVVEPIKASKPSPAPSHPSNISVGSKVKVIGSKYVTGQSIPSWVNKATYTVQEVKGDRALIKEITSWVYLKDLSLVSGGSPAPSKPNSYLVEITASILNVRKGPATSYGVVTSVKKGDVFTIVDENNGWGKLKSGAGWISLNYTKRI